METEESIKANLNIVNEFALGFVKIQNVLCGQCDIKICKITINDMVECIKILKEFEKN